VLIKLPGEILAGLCESPPLPHHCILCLLSVYFSTPHS